MFVSANIGQALVDDIHDPHRRIELWGEGFRYYDLKRLAQPLDPDRSQLTQPRQPVVCLKLAGGRIRDGPS